MELVSLDPRDCCVCSYIFQPCWYRVIYNKVQWGSMLSQGIGVTHDKSRLGMMASKNALKLYGEYFAE